MILEIQDTLVSMDILTEEFCCDLTKCKGQCCVEGDAGAPVSLDEVAEIENHLEEAWPLMAANAQAVVDKQGVAYVDQEGDLVTSIVNGKDCVFTRYGQLDLGEGTVVDNCCLCALHEFGCKPISCHLYPIRVKRLSNGQLALNYNRWSVCSDAVKRGRELHIPVYKFLREPLIRLMGEEWYAELEIAAKEIAK